MKQPEALRLADELESVVHEYDIDRLAADELRRLHEENTALRQAIKEAALDGLAETSRDIEFEMPPAMPLNSPLAEQEPVAWMYIDPDNEFKKVHIDDCDYSQFPNDEWFPVYTAPMSIKPENIDTKSGCVDGVDIEPVAWMTNSEQDVTAEFLFSHVQTPMHKIPLYEAPPKRKWVGLTDKEVDNLVGFMRGHTMSEFARAIEAKLKEKNSG